MNRNRLVKLISNFFIPPKCMFCSEILQDDSCPRCCLVVKSLQLSEQEMIIKETYTKFKSLDFCISFYEYKSIVRAAILKAKFHNCASFIEMFLSYIPIDIEAFARENKIDMIISTPIHSSKLYKQEFDLPQEMAKKIAKATNLEYNYSLIKKIKKTQKQHDLSRTERKTNLNDAFSVKGEVKGKNILIIDDILTTGHTLDEVAKTLKSAGAAKVIGMTFTYNKYEEGKGHYGS